MDASEIITEFNRVFAGKYNKARWKTVDGRKLRNTLIDSPFFNFESIDQKVWALRNNTFIRPTCVVCDKYASFRHGKFNSTCGSSSCAKLNPEAKAKVSKTNLLRYGNICPLKNETVKQKSINTSMKNYGVKHPMQNKDFAEAQRQAYTDKTGLKSIFDVPEIRAKSSKLAQSPEAKAKRARSLIQTKGDIKFKNKLYERYEKSILQSRLMDLQKRQNIVALFSRWGGKYKKYKWLHETCGHEFESHFIRVDDFLCPRCKPRSIPQEKVLVLCEDLGIKVLENDRIQIKPREIDLWLPDHKVGIEVNGIYWHNAFRRGLTLLQKTNMLKQGLLLHFWDFEIHLYPEIVKNVIAVKTQNIKSKFYARKCNIIEVSNEDAQIFIDTNNLLGFVESDFHVGLRYNNEIIAIASFINDVGFIKMTRFTCKLGSITVGGLSRLTSFVFKKLNQKIIADVDLRFSNGSSYEAAGFSRVGIKQPEAKYFMQKYNSRPLAITEINLEHSDKNTSKESVLIDAGWLKIIDCGHARYIFNEEV